MAQSKRWSVMNGDTNNYNPGGSIGSKNTFRLTPDGTSGSRITGIQAGASGNEFPFVENVPNISDPAILWAAIYRLRAELSTAQATFQSGVSAGLTFAHVKHAKVESSAEYDKLMTERDYAEEMCDKLAEAISSLTGSEIGEHSSSNCPWENALVAASTTLDRKADL